MKNIKNLLILVFAFCSLSLQSTYEGMKRVALTHINRFPENLDEVFFVETAEDIKKQSPKNLKDVITASADWDCIALRICVEKYKRQAAISCLEDKTEEEKNLCIKNAQEQATACIERFSEFRQSYQAYNVGGTKSGSDFLDYLANHKFSDY